jgi:L-gulonolactone oxidase
VNGRGYLPVLLTHHLVEFFLFLARFIPFLAIYIARYVAWMESAPKVVIGESGSILRTDCRVCFSVPLPYSYLTDHI